MNRLVFGVLTGILFIPTISSDPLAKFQYFKNFPPKEAGLHPIEELFLKKKAVLEYILNTLYGPQFSDTEVAIEFNPHFGKAWQPYFERHYGRRAERLIDLLGKGVSVNKLKYHGAISRDYGFYK